MNQKLFVANWKSNKTSLEAIQWLEELRIKNHESRKENTIILCPPFTLLSDLKLQITNYKLPILLGAQNISPFGDGAYTGEVHGKQIKEFADYVIVGHSERRKNFGESSETINKKIEQALQNGLTPILCVSELGQLNEFPFKEREKSMIIAYEPLFAIGSGNPDTPENANEVARQIKEKVGKVPVLYGGSVTPHNVQSFLHTSDIDGVLVGSASLNPSEFATILSHA